MKKVWNMASWTAGAPGNHFSNIVPKVVEWPDTILRTRAKMRNRTTPIILKRRWIRAVLLAFVPLAMLAMMALTHVPMLDPMLK